MMPTITTVANVPTHNRPTHPTDVRATTPTRCSWRMGKVGLEPRNATASSVSPAGQHSPPPPSVKPITCPPTNETQQSNARALHPSIPPYVVSIHLLPITLSLQNAKPLAVRQRVRLQLLHSLRPQTVHSPSSRGNSDIDDQVERYIRDQRVATVVTTPNDNTRPTRPRIRCSAILNQPTFTFTPNAPSRRTTAP